MSFQTLTIAAGRLQSSLAAYSRPRIALEHSFSLIAVPGLLLVVPQVDKRFLESGPVDLLKRLITSATALETVDPPPARPDRTSEQIRSFDTGYSVRPKVSTLQSLAPER